MGYSPMQKMIVRWSFSYVMTSNSQMSFAGCICKRLVTYRYCLVYSIQYIIRRKVVVGTPSLSSDPQTRNIKCVKRYKPESHPILSINITSWRIRITLFERGTSRPCFFLLFFVGWLLPLLDSEKPAELARELWSDESMVPLVPSSWNEQDRNLTASRGSPLRWRFMASLTSADGRWRR
jgi:hypothetical protein